MSSHYSYSKSNDSFDQILNRTKQNINAINQRYALKNKHLAIDNIGK